MVTFMGMVVALSGVTLLLFYDYTLAQNIPNWTFFYLSFSCFGYQTLDALDGLHARNIKASSPLGQIFDHGIDALLHGVLITTHLQALKTGGSLLSFVYFHGLVVFLGVTTRL